MRLRLRRSPAGSPAGFGTGHPRGADHTRSAPPPARDVLRALTLLVLSALAGCGTTRSEATAAGWQAQGQQRAAASAHRSAPVSPGRVDSFTVLMSTLGGRERTVRVYLPPGYDDAGGDYPVLYLQDAQSLFSAGPYGDWRADETVDSLVAAGVFPGLIMVGVDNGPARWDEYGPWPNTHMADWVDLSWARPTEGGEGGAYVDFLVGTLKPEIDRRYRTRPGPEDTGIGGSSMGGLIALYAGVTRPDVFSRVLAMSSAVWFAEAGGPWLSGNRLLAAIRDAGGADDDDGRARVRRPLSASRFYLDVGTAERSRDTDPDVLDKSGARLTYPRAYVEGTSAVARALAAAGVPARRIRVAVVPGAIHHESAWARRLGPALQWLFRD